MASTSTELFAAIDAGNRDRVRALLEDDPTLAEARAADGVSALMHARYRRDRDLVAIIRAHVTALDMFEAAALDDAAQLADALVADPSLTARSADGFTPLHLAAFFGSVEATALLLSRGAAVDAAATGWMTGTPLHGAAAGRHLDVGLLLLDAGANPNARQSGGWTALHAAAANGDAAFVRTLLARGADPETKSDDGRTPASLARDGGDADTIAALGTR